MNQSILLIEDCQEMAENISEILTLAHYRVLVAPNGKVGVELAQRERPNLILCDVMMPELDGYGVLYILSNDPNTAQIPFIFLTAKSECEDMRRGMDMGADDYIIKPFDGVNLLKVVEVRLRKSQVTNGNFKGGNNAAGIGFNETLEARALEQLLENKPVRTFRKREYIFMEGQNTNDVFFIRKGNVKTYKLNYEGKELITGIFTSQEFVGYPSILEEKPNNQSAEALEESELVVIPRSEFISAVYSSKEMARKFIKMLSTNLEVTEERLVDIAYQSVRQRVARALLRVISPNNGEMIKMRRRDLANLIGTATESLNRTLADFKDEGLVEITSTGIKVVDSKKLEKLIR